MQKQVPLERRCLSFTHIAWRRHRARHSEQNTNQGEDSIKIRSTVVALALCLSLFAPLANTYASARAVSAFAPVTVPITGTMAGGGTLSGVFTIEKFVLQNGQIFAQGTMTATLLNKLGGVIGTITTGISLILSAINVIQQGANIRSFIWNSARST